MYLHLIDRSNLNDIVAIKPGGIKVSRRQDLTDGMCPRSDVVLMNCTNTSKEYCLYVTETDFAGDMFLLDVLSPEQYETLIAFADKMRSNAIEYPPARKLIVG